MTDGLNDARKMRIEEVMTDLKVGAMRINSFKAQPAQSDYYTAGYSLLRQCTAEAQSILPSGPGGGRNPNGDIPAYNNSSNDDPEQVKRVLQRSLLDASSRRFRMHKSVLRATACIRWVNKRNQILKGKPPQPEHAEALRELDQQLHSEIAPITDQIIDRELHAKDQAAGCWIAEMPSLQQILAYNRMIAD